VKVHKQPGSLKVSGAQVWVITFGGQVPVGACSAVNSFSLEEARNVKTSRNQAMMTNWRRKENIG
jgi:hypothetical protein